MIDLILLSLVDREAQNLVQQIFFEEETILRDEDSNVSC